MPYDGYTDYFEEPVIVSVATTGGLHGKDANPNLPEQPDEVIDDLVECEAAGASVVHLHARDNDGDPTKDIERFQRLSDLVREETELLLNLTTGGSRFPAEDRIRPVLEVSPPPEMATLDMGPLNIGPDRTAINTREQCEDFARRLRDRGIKPELEIFNPGHFEETNHLIGEALVEEPYWITLILGMQTGTVPDPRNLQNLVDNLPEGANWQCIGIGKHQLPLSTAAMVHGGHVRVGLEDNVYYRAGELAESNAQLVERAVRIADELERPVATPAQAREIIGC